MRVWSYEDDGDDGDEDAADGDEKTMKTRETNTAIDKDDDDGVEYEEDQYVTLYDIISFLTMEFSGDRLEAGEQNLNVCGCPEEKVFTLYTVHCAYLCYSDLLKN